MPAAPEIQPYSLQIHAAETATVDASNADVSREQPGYTSPSSLALVIENLLPIIGAPLVVLLLLIALKIGIDLKAYQKQHPN